MPVKWKIFRVISYLHIAAAMAILLFLIYATWEIRLNSLNDVLTFSLFILLALIYVANSLINLFLLERYYPDQRPGKTLHIWNWIFYVLFIILLGLSIVVAYFTTMEMMRFASQYGRYSMHRQLMLVAILWAICLTGIPITIYQPVLRNAILHNYRKTMDSFFAPENP